MEFLKENEEKWQKNWENAKTFEANPNPKKPKFFITFPYPYMNGPLHVGHTFTASRVDAFARFKRMQGYNVLFPWAWHWTGQPLAGASQRVAKGDEAFIRSLREVDGVPEEDLAKFSDPINMATYYTNDGRLAARRAGFSVDWRREFNTFEPAYQKFIEWQYENLRKMGYVTKGTHPVVWCPKCKSPTGDHDRQVGEGVAPEEYTLIKFSLDKDTYLPAATFRPETIFGITNIWLNPDVDYVEAEVDKEKWVISEAAAEKLKEQRKTVKITRHIKGKALIGKTFENPATKGKLLILPGWFVNPQHATGVVYSVPAHAPYDWLALRDLQQKPEILKQFDIDPETVKSIQPISLIQVEGFGKYPAVEIVEQMKVKDQNDPKADEATKELYKKEFHGGVLNENCREYAGKAVREVKDRLINDFKTRGLADSMYDLPQQVQCRCLTPCIVKVLQDQWFLNYSDAEWKGKTHQALRNMSVYPEASRQWFVTVIDWLREWACARTTGFGTPLPWGPGWIIETLSDSTIYMAYYTVNKHIHEGKITAEMLTREVFDYVFFGKGKVEDTVIKSKIPAAELKAMRDEFLYWYPVDMRVSAKELVPNHLTFFIFHHVALFPKEHWPKAIGVNGMLMIEGKQMHKSKGNFITAKNAIEQYGADATRCALLLAAEGMDDPDWRRDNVRDTCNKIESFHTFAEDIMENASAQDNGHLENWLMSTMQRRIEQVTENLEQMKTRTALEIAFFEVWNDFRWYKRRKGHTISLALKEAMKIWLKLLAPFAPHICEETWNLLGEKGFISTAPWPKAEPEQVDAEIEESENFIKTVVEDTQSVIRATRTAPAKIHYYVSAPWKWRLHLAIIERSTQGRPEHGKLIKELLNQPALKEHAKEVAALTPKLAEEIAKMSPEKRGTHLTIGILDEEEILRNAEQFLVDEFRARVHVLREIDAEKYDPKQRAKLARPHRPAIYIE